MITQLVILFFAMILNFFLYCSLFYLGILQSVEILFYRGIFLALLLSCSEIVLLTLFSMFLKPWSSTKKACLAMAIICSFCINTTWLVIVPVSIDRSITCFLLREIRSAEKGVSLPNLEQKVIDHYIRENSAVMRRLYEQEYSGNITNNQSLFTLTEQGKTFINFSENLISIFRITSPLEQKSSPSLN